MYVYEQMYVYTYIILKIYVVLCRQNSFLKLKNLYKYVSSGGGISLYLVKEY